MIIRSDEIKDGDIIETDICVVGAGPAGITFAREFINSSQTVTLLESGTLQYDEHQKVQELNRGKNEPINEEVKKGIPHYELHKIRARAFGGTSQMWCVPLPEGLEGIRLRGMDRIDFEKRDWVPYSGWPIEKKDLDPYYRRAHEVFKIGPYNYSYEFWEKRKKGTDAVLSTENLKTTFFQFGRKDVFYRDYFRELKIAENINIILNSTVLKIQLNEEGNKSDRVLVSNLDGLKFTVKAKYFVLSLGGIETPRLMLLSDDVMKKGVGNQNDLVGRFFMEHPHVRTGMFYPSDHSFFDNASIYDIHSLDEVVVEGNITLCKELINKEKLLNSCASLRHVPMAGLLDSELAIKSLISALKSFNFKSVGKSLRTILKNRSLISYITIRKLAGGNKKKWYDTKYKYHGYRLSFKSEQIPDPESRVLLDEDLDQFGQRRP